ncbi:MAG: molybdopterin-guanine dinucleotide biosynthesis protein B [Candidatus Bathyarchaeia archaeon]
MSKNHVVLVVLGMKSSGKTTAVEAIVKTLTSKGFSVMTVKHVAHPRFTVDREGTDTWRHWKAGARIVATVSDIETAIMIKERIDLRGWLDLMGKADIIVFEGFSSTLLKDENAGKVICVRNLSERNFYINNLKGKLVALCSLNLKGEGILRLGLDDDTLSEAVLRYVREMIRTGDV